MGVGLSWRSPCTATLYTVLRRVERDFLEAKLGAWAESLRRGTPGPEGVEGAVAMDGKTLRGSQQLGAPGVPLLPARAHRCGLTLAQHAIADQTNEIPVVLELLHHVVLEGRVVTMDALLTPRQMAQQVDAGEGLRDAGQREPAPALGRHADGLCPRPDCR